MAEASRIEPDSPIPPALAAWTHYFESGLGLGDSPRDCIDAAMTFADQAIALDDPSGMAYMLKGTLYLIQAEHEKALDAAEKALEDRPSCPWAFALKGHIYNYTGKPAEASAVSMTSRSSIFLGSSPHI